MKCGYVDTPEGQVHYRTEGDGECILLLHQSPLCGEEYLDMMPVLARKYQALAVDYLGHGNSADPVKEPGIEDYARNIISVLDKLSIKKTSLVGHHTGALIALELAVAYPERISKVIFSGLPVYSLEEWKAFLSQPMSRSMPMTADGAFVAKTWERYRGLCTSADPAVIFKPFIIALKSRHRPYDAHFAAGRYDVRPRLGKIQCPTLLVSGSKDMFLSQLDSTRKLIPVCQTGIVDGGGLFINFEKPVEFANMILDFMRKA